MTTHKQALADYDALHEIAGGGPSDSGERYDQIAEKLLANPTARCAQAHLEELIGLYYSHGGPMGEDLTGDGDARNIFARYGLMGN